MLRFWLQAHAMVIWSKGLKFKANSSKSRRHQPPVARTTYQTLHTVSTTLDRHSLGHVIFSGRYVSHIILIVYSVGAHGGFTETDGFTIVTQFVDSLPYVSPLTMDDLTLDTPAWHYVEPCKRPSDPCNPFGDTLHSDWPCYSGIGVVPRGRRVDFQEWTFEIFT